MKIYRKTDDAISPVVGVMLMLVTTILIASLVIAFGSASLEGVEGTPTAVISMTDYRLELQSPSEGYNIEEIALTHMSGDSLKLENVKLVLHYNGMLTQLDLHGPTLNSNDEEFCTITADNDGFWSPGEILVITHKPGVLNGGYIATGLLGYSMFTPNDIEFQIVTVDGSVITNGYLHFG